MEIQIEELKGTLQLSEDAEKDLQKERIAWSKTEKNLKIDLEVVATRLKSTERDKSEYVRKCRDFKEDVELLQITLKRRENDNKELTKKFNACEMNETHLKTELTEVNARLERAEGEKRRYLKNCDDLTKQIVQFESKLQHLKDEKENLLKKVNGLETDLDHERTLLERTERTKIKHSRECKELEKQIENLERRLQKSEDKNKELEKKCNNCSTNEETLKVELKHMNNRLELAKRAEKERIPYLKRCNDLKKQTAEPESKLTQCSEDQTKERTILESPGRGKTASGSRKSGTQGRNNRLFYFKSSSLAVTVFIRLRAQPQITAHLE